MKPILHRTARLALLLAGALALAPSARAEDVRVFDAVGYEELEKVLKIAQTNNCKSVIRASGGFWLPRETAALLNEFEEPFALICNADYADPANGNYTLKSTAQDHWITIDGEGSGRCLDLSDAPDGSFIYGLGFINGRTDDEGGGVYCDNNVMFAKCRFTDCVSTEDHGGAIAYPAYAEHLLDENGPWKWLHSLSRDQFQFGKYPSNYSVWNCTFSNCCAEDDDDGRGGAIYGDNSGGNSGWIADCTFDDCKAYYGGATYYCQRIERCIFRNCKASYSGGACYTDDDIIEASLFVNCNSPKEGGAITAWSFLLRHCTFINCSSDAGYATYGSTSYDNYMENCLVIGSNYGDGRTADDYIGSYGGKVDASAGFVDYAGGDYHVKSSAPDAWRTSEVSTKSYEGSSWECFPTTELGDIVSLDYITFRQGGKMENGSWKTIVNNGCYAYFTPEDYEEYKKTGPHEYTTEGGSLGTYVADVTSAAELAGALQIAIDRKCDIIVRATGTWDIGRESDARKKFDKINSDGKIRFALICNADYDGSAGGSHTIKSTKLKGTITFAGDGSSSCLECDDCKKGSLIYGAKFTAGGGEHGAAYGNGRVVFYNCSFANCDSTYYGGAIYGPVSASDFSESGGKWDWLRQQKGAVDFDEIVGLDKYTVWKCSFSQCTAKKYGGAITAGGAGYWGWIADCEFTECSSTEEGGGAIYAAEKVERCSFRSCKASEGEGGAIYGVDVTESSLFIDCTSKKCGAAIYSSASYGTLTYQCTFIRCTTTEDDSSYGACYNTDSKQVWVENSIFVGCGYSADNDSNDADGTNPHGCFVFKTETDEAKAVFVNYGSDYHIAPASGAKVDTKKGDSYVYDGSSWGLLKKKTLFKDIMSMDGAVFGMSSNQVAGCYRYYTQEEWDRRVEEEKTPEWELMDPLVVTTLTDITNPKDCIISFREACAYLQDKNKLELAANASRISFKITTSDRAVCITNTVSITDSSPTVTTIDGGDAGITLACAEGAETAELTSTRSLSVKNVIFRLGGVTCSWGGAGDKVSFSNCRFAKTKLALRNTPAALERCTFASYNGDVMTYAPDASDAFTCSACTFAECGGGLFRLEGNTSAKVNFINCTFFECTGQFFTTSGSAKTGDVRMLNCIIAGGQNPSVGAREATAYAGSDDLLEVLDSLTAVRRTVNGVEQVSYRPKHKLTARGGVASWSGLSAPALDVFGERQTGRYFSQGSMYVDDRETPSKVVTTGSDSDDPYDDEISLREAVGYLCDDLSMASGGYLTPEFSPDFFPSGAVALSLTGQVAIAARAGDETTFIGFPFRLMPGEGQSLTIRTQGDRGAFWQGEGTVAEFRNVTFACRTTGDGGVLDSAGEFYIRDCRFDSCHAGGRGGAICARNESANGFLYNVTASGCDAGGDGGFIFNLGTLRGVNMTVSGGGCNGEGGAVKSHTGAKVTEFAACAFVGAKAKSGSAQLHAKSSSIGIVDTVVVGAQGGAKNVCATGSGAAVWTCASCYDDDRSVTDVFSSATPVATNLPGRVSHLYYPLKDGGPAQGTGVFVFFTEGAGKGGGSNPNDDIGEETSAGTILWSNDAEGDGGTYVAKPIGDSKKKGISKFLLYDLLGNLIAVDVTPSMGPVQRILTEVPTGRVNVTGDGDDPHDGAITFREAAEYAMEHGVPVAFEDGLFSDGMALFPLVNQIVVPAGRRLEVLAPEGNAVVLGCPEGASNRFFRVEEGGSLRLSGVILYNGRAHGEYASVAKPIRDEDGGAVCGAGDLSFESCEFLENAAPQGAGGAIWASGELLVSNCYFYGNWAHLTGGAIHSEKARATIVDSMLEQNRAEIFGGGIYIAPGAVTNEVTRTDVVLNTARRGGGICCGDGDAPGRVTVDAVDTRVIGNVATDPNWANYADVFAGVGFTYNEELRNSVSPEFYTVKTENGIAVIELSEKATPVVNALDMSNVGSGDVSVKVENPIAGLYYGLGSSESPAGPYEVREWIRAEPGKPLRLEAPAEGSSGFYRAMVTEDPR